MNDNNEKYCSSCGFTEEQVDIIAMFTATHEVVAVCEECKRIVISCVNLKD